MKTFIQCAVFFLSFLGMAQTGINYKAVLNDSSGNPIVNSLVVVQFSIYATSPTGTLVYQEDHAPTTDANGIVILNIGLGNASLGVFENINWSSNDYFLNVQINTGGGFTDLGTTQFMAVPLAINAINAINANTASNVLGLTVIDEGNGNGWRLARRDPVNYGNIGLGAVDLSNSVIQGDQFGASGNFSFAVGSQVHALGPNAIVLGNSSTSSGASAVSFGSTNIASGDFAVAMGSSSEASGFLATAMGSFTLASGPTSTSFGSNTMASGFTALATGRSSIASGAEAAAFGNGTIAAARNTFAIGRYNVGTGSAVDWILDEPLFEIGNGTSETDRNNAVTVLKNGNVGIGVNNPTNTLQMLGRFQFGSIEFLEDGGFNQIAFGASLRPTLDSTSSIGNSTFRWNSIWAVDGTINTSDRRDKTNIEGLEYGLNELMQLHPVRFNWKDKPSEEKKLGLIAQDLLQVIPEVVKTHDWQSISEKQGAERQRVEIERMGVYYSDLIPVLIKAIQEQNVSIEEQKSLIKEQQKQINELRELIKVSLLDKN